MATYFPGDIAGSTVSAAGAVVINESNISQFCEKSLINLRNKNVRFLKGSNRRNENAYAVFGINDAKTMIRLIGSTELV